MKTSLNFIALVFAASLPITLAAESIGLRFPGNLDIMSVFAGFTAILVLLTAVGDYSRPHQAMRRTVAFAMIAGTRKARYPLAA